MPFTCKTRGMSHPGGKPRLFFCCHPADFEKYFEPISKLILAKQNCAIWYDPDNEGLTEDNRLELGEMQLFVVPVTSNLLLSLNAAMDELIPFALERHIPVLPLMQECGLEQVYGSRFGDIQYLDKNEQDATTLSFEKKVERYLSSVLVGDELARQVRAAFDAYIFLSYRKKDRKYANELMRLIHKNEFCRDIAIWYDEYLVPGENFNDSIAEALKKCDVFTLAVTPNMVNEVNYVMTTEYPEIRRTDKPILPAELVPTDREQMREKYEGIPECVDARNEEQLSDALLEALRGIAKMENDGDPQHNFFIGLAYLGGIDVEVDYDRALYLITEAAEAGLDEAIEQLIGMYQTGNGVERNYLTAIRWRERQVELWEERYEESGSVDDEEALNTAMFELSVDWSGIGRIDEAIVAAERSVQIREDLVEKYSDPAIYSVEEHRLVRRLLCVNLSLLGNYYLMKYDYEKAMDLEVQVIQSIQDMISELSDKETDAKMELETMLAREIISFAGIVSIGDDSEKNQKAQEELLSFVMDILEKHPQMEETAERDLWIEYYLQLGKLCGKRGDVGEAAESYGRALRLRLDKAEESGALDDRLAVADTYREVGDLGTEHGGYEIAKEYYGKALALYEELLSEDETQLTLREGLGLCYYGQGKLYRKCENYDEAKESYGKGVEVFRALTGETEIHEFRNHLDYGTRELGEVCMELGNLYSRQEEWETAQEAYLKAAGYIDTDTTDPEKIRKRIDCLERAAYATEQMEEYYTAAVCYEEILNDREKLVKLNPTVEERCGLIETYRDIIASYAMADEARDVLEYGEMAIDPARELAQETNDPEHRDLCGEITYYLVYVTEGEKRQQLWKECCGIYERLADEYPDSERYARLKEHVAGMMGN